MPTILMHLHLLPLLAQAAVVDTTTTITTLAREGGSVGVIVALVLVVRTLFTENRSQQAEMKALQGAHNGKLAENSTAYATLQKAHNEEVKALQKAHTEEVKALQKAHTDEIKDLQSQCMEDARRWQSEHNAEVTRIRERYDALTDETRRAREAETAVFTEGSMAMADAMERLGITAPKQRTRKG